MKMKVKHIWGVHEKPKTVKLSQTNLISSVYQFIGKVLVDFFIGLLFWFGLITSGANKLDKQIYFPFDQ